MADFDPLASHAVHGALDDLFALEGNENLAESNAAIEPVHHWSIQRVFAIATEAKLIIEKIPPGEASLGALDALTNGLNKAKAELLNFTQNGNAAHINNARAQAENNVLVHTKRLCPIGFEVHPRTEAALESYKRKAREASRRQKKVSSDLREELTDLQKMASQEKQNLDGLSVSVETTKSENESLLSELRKADADRIERQTTAANEALLEAEKKVSELIAEKEKRLEGALSSSRDKARKAVNEVEKKREEASAIVQSVGDLLTTGTYADRANKETAKADLFRNITVGLFALGLIIILSTYIIYAIGTAFGAEVSITESWQSLVARVTTGLAVTLPAFYTARESARHRTNADVAKQRELELTTLGPFIELLPDEQKTAIRDRLTDRYFGGEVEPHDVKVPVDVNNLAKAIAELSKKSVTSGE